MRSLRNVRIANLLGLVVVPFLQLACADDDAPDVGAGAAGSGGRSSAGSGPGTTGGKAAAPEGGQAGSLGSTEGGAVSAAATAGGAGGENEGGAGGENEGGAGGENEGGAGGEREGGTGGESGAPAVGLTSTLGRLLIADADPERPRMLVVDLDDGSLAGEFATLGTVSAYASESTSGYAWANQRVPGVVEIVASGIHRAEDGSVAKAAPYVLGQRLQGPLPTHWVSHDEWIVSFNDGDGSFDFVLERALGGTRPLFSRATTGRAHHGVAMIAHGNVIATVPHPLAGSGEPGPGSAYVLPIGVSVRRLATPDTVIADQKSEDCPLLHGEAGNDEVVAFGCGDGVLLAERTGGAFQFRKLLNPPSTPEGQRVGTLRAADGVPVVIGNWGQGFAIIPYQEAEPTWITVDLGATNNGFLIDPESLDLIVLAGDGSLRRFDALTGARVEAPLTKVVPAIEAGQTTPGFTLGHGVAYVADPRSGKVVEVDLEQWKVTRTLEVGGQPRSLAAFGRVVEGG
jgi:hypothetical protein